MIIMKRTLTFAMGAVLLMAVPAAAQESTPAPAASPEPTAVQEPAKPDKARPITIQYFRPVDQRGVNIFESPKEEGVAFTGFKLDFNGAFSSQLQDLKHSNTSDPVLNSTGVNTNELAAIGRGFNTSMANFYINAQLYKGVRVQTTVFLSSRHHNEAWVKDGYVLIDESPIDIKPLNALFKYMTIRAGHMEVNYGDAHFRRTDNGNAIYNPFVGNYILDSFTTEMGGEVYLRSKGVIAMAAIMGGEIKGDIRNTDKRAPAYIGKLGFDRQLNDNLRVRLTGSVYKNSKSPSNTLFHGDRSGSHYFAIMENTLATDTAQAWSGLLDPGLSNSVTAVQVNPFVKYGGLEAFGIIEQAKGKKFTETADRTWKQQAVDVVYRLFPGEAAYVGMRYNRVRGEVLGIANEIGATRWHIGAGWFVLPGVLLKVEHVVGKYQDWPANNIFNGGEYRGNVMEGVIAF
jgi:hypothetical protein